MRVLFLTPELPHPAHSGGTIKTASVLDYLRRRHEVHVLCFRRRPLTEAQADWCATEGPVETVPLMNRGRTALNLLSSYLRGLPLSVERNRSSRMTGLVSERLAGGKYDVLFVDSWLMAQYLPPAFSGLAVLHEHNAEHVMWRRQAERERNPLLRMLIRLEYRRVRGYEAAILPRFDAIFAVSEADRRALIELGGRPERLRALPNVPDRALLDLPALSYAGTEPVILYFGTLSWQPNIEGLTFFLGSVFPRVRCRVSDARFVIAGRGAPPRLRSLARRTPGVEFLGPVVDAEPLFRRARVFVEASGSGGGTRLKVLNALARGLPVVASPEGAEGLDLVAGEHLLVADDPESMAEAVTRLLADEKQWRSLSERGRALIRRRYLAEVAFAPLDEALSAGAATRPEGQSCAEVVPVLGVRFHNLSRSEAARAIAEMARANGKGYVVKPYSEFMPRAARAARFRDILNGADLCLADGIGILWAAHYLTLRGGPLRALIQLPLSLAAVVLNQGALRTPLRENMAGVDLTWEMLARLDETGARVFLLGGTEEELHRTQEQIEGRFASLRVVGARHGYFDVQGEENEEILGMIDNASPDVLLVAMGSPRQEEWIGANLPRLGAKVAVAEGGSFSFISGVVPRAPCGLRRLGLEWLFRLLRQPWRVRRQMAIAQFLWLVVRERLRSGTPA
jgi:exopolysaccharide biosynthesis WecB/TagA/CpsF family protein